MATHLRMRIEVWETWPNPPSRGDSTAMRTKGVLDQESDHGCTLLFAKRKRQEIGNEMRTQLILPIYEQKKKPDMPVPKLTVTTKQVTCRESRTNCFFVIFPGTFRESCVVIQWCAISPPSGTIALLAIADIQSLQEDGERNPLGGKLRNFAPKTLKKAWHKRVD